MAAVITQFQYGHGIVAYINGVEIFRDNMPAGDVSQGTMASGSYATAEYHGVIRPAAVAEAAQSVLAVELHFTDGSIYSINCTAVENEVADNRFQRSELDYLIYNDPLAYADLVLNGDVEAYLNAVTEYQTYEN